MAQSKGPFEQRKASSLLADLLLRIFFAACITLGPLTFLLYAILGSSGMGGQAIIAANRAENATMNQLHLLFGVLASFLLPVGFLGLAWLSLRRAPWLGSLSVILALPGWTPLSALIALNALTYDMAQMRGGTQFAELWDRFNADGVTFSYTVIYAICHLLCAVLVGIALGRTRLIPIWAAVAFVISSPLFIIGFPTRLSILLLLGLALLTIGSVPASLAMLKFSDEMTPVWGDELSVPAT